ncbi:MAG: discoidin domain-containing protein [Planctomycetes bacterium]|nr:discoidin domain-containing protein [Planctomycetota bacterium]
MSKKLIYLVSFVLVLCSVGNAASIQWTGLGSNNLWSNPANWEFNAVPTSADEVFIEVPAAAAPNGPVIRDGISAVIFGLACEMAGEPMMTMTGGTLDVRDWIWWGDGPGSHGTFYMSGGTVTVVNELELGWGGGEGTWIMTGGTVNAGELIIPTSSGAAGQLYLHGGTFNVGSIGLEMSENGLIDIGEGVLVLKGDLTTIINGFIAARQITAYGGVGTVLVTYNGLNTTVAAIGSPKATNPNPADEATDALREIVLGWTPGIYVPPTNGHNVYFSESFNDVNDGIGGIAQDANSYAPAQRLDFGTTYYWRVDEVNGPPDYTVYEGNIWSFTTELFAYPVENITATASSTSQEGMGPENTINGSGLDVSDLHSIVEMDMWLSGDEPNGAWIEYEFDKVYKLHQMWVWNHNGTMEFILGFGLKDVTVEYSTNGTIYTTLGTTHEFAQAPGTPDYEHNTTVAFGGATAKYVRLTANSNWGAGLLDQYGLSEVRFLHIPVRAKYPSPDSGAIDVAVDVTLGFRAGREADKHDVYLSSDEQAVIDSTAGVTTVTETSYGPLSLDLDTTYYWKINEVNEAETPVTWEGDLWSFTTTDHFIVDDFEDYNDYSPNEIWAAWVDGYGVPANGATAGYPSPDWNQGEHFVETAIVHDGDQSMPFFYGNTGGATYSEGERTFAVPQDWTAAGVQTLTLYFHGTAGNTGQLYVKVNGSKVVYEGDAGNLALAEWQAWNIELASFGVDLQSVTTLGIGIDGNGASGTLYFDGIRLYRSKPVVFLFDDFEGYADDAGLTAAGWTILDTPAVTETGTTWTITNPGGRVNPATLNGSASTGNFLISDSDKGGGSNPTDSGASHDVITPSFSTAGADKVWLHMDLTAQLNNNGAAIFDVDVSIDGGSTWTNVFSRVAPGRISSNSATTRLPDNTNTDGYYGQLDVDLTPYAANQGDVRLRIRHFEPNDDWYIAIDNVLVDDVAAPQGGPITVFSEDFSNGLGQMEVFSGQGNTGTETWHTTDKGGRYVPGTVQERGVNRLGPHPGATPDFAIIESDADPDPAEDEWLMTPTLDLSGMTEVFLHYNSETVVYGGTEVQEVLISLDGGNTFEVTPIFDYNGGGLWDSGEEPFYAERIFDVSDIAAGQSQVVFAFHFQGDGNDYWWAIDNVEVSGVPGE